MNLTTDLLWMAGAALSLGFLAYGGYLLLFIPKLEAKRVTAAPRVEHGRLTCAN